MRLTLSLLILIVGMYLVLAVRYATETPDWQVPDEPAHYNYIRQLEDGAIPVIRMGDWDTEYQNTLTSTGFNPIHLNKLDRIQYEDHQPPLYYILATPIFAASDGNLTTLRLFSVFIGLGVILASFAVLYRLFPEMSPLALGVAAFIAFLPQHLSFLSGVNNDPLAGLMVGLILLRVVTYLQKPTVQKQDAILLGVLVGLACLTKVTVYFLAGVAGVAILLRGGREKWSRPVAIQQIGLFLLPALVMGGVWWGRNLSVYGGTDFLGLQRHDEVAAGQLQTDDYIERDLNGNRTQYYKNYAYTTFHSFWGQFGWMAIPMPTRIYRILLGGVLFCLMGFGLFALQNHRHWQRPQKEMLFLLMLTLGLVGAAYLLYNRQFVQFQGRYLYPALIPMGFLLAGGLSGWAHLLPAKPYTRWMPVLVMLLLALLAWYALGTYITPNLPAWE